jgi:hypothetical protein
MDQRVVLGLTGVIVGVAVLAGVAWSLSGGPDSDGEPQEERRTAPVQVAPREPLPAAPVVHAAMQDGDASDGDGPAKGGPEERAAWWADLDERLREVKQVSWDQRSEAEWRAIADELAERVDEMEALPCDEKVANVGTIIELLVQSGRAGENANQIPAPEFGRVDGQNMNLRWYRAASILYDEGLDLPEEGELKRNIAVIEQNIGDLHPELGLCEAFVYEPLE